MDIGSYLEAWQRIKEKGVFRNPFLSPAAHPHRLTNFKDNINKRQPYIDNETQLNDTETTEF